MSRSATPSSRFVQEMLRLYAERTQAPAEDRAEVDDAVAHLIRMNGAGRLEEYFANRERTDA